jgi:intracellular multiplication protein IcmW
MPKLDLQSAHEYWNQFNDPMIYRVVAFMESVEDWTKDGDPQLEAAIDKLGDALETLTTLKVSEEENFIKLATFLKMPRLLRMLQAVDTIEPGSASKFLMFAEEKSASNALIALFLRRNIVFERLRLLTRVFSPARFSLILRALENE